MHPAYAPALARRGATYRVLKRYDDALANLSSALSYNSTNSWFLYQHALVCLLKGDRQTGDASLASAVSLARQSYTQNPDDLNEPLMLMLYLMASGNIADGRSLFEELITGVPLYALRTAADVFDDYLVSFPANADAQAIRAELQAEIERRQSEGSPDQT